MNVTWSDLSWIGIWLLVAAAVVIVAELALAGIWTVRIAKRSRELSRRIATERAGIQADVEQLHLGLAETTRLWEPYGRALRYLRHPLVIALVESYSRRRTSPR